MADNAGRQSDKVDLGANRAEAYAVYATADFTGETPVAGEIMRYKWLSSTRATQANGNAGIVLRGDNGNAQLTLVNTGGDSAIGIADADGKLTWTAP